MPTLTMQGIAQLAQVQRPVVSMWRSRFAHSVPPFPQPVQDFPLQFDAAQVAQWLQETEHGNNGDAHLEAALHSTALQCVIDNPDHASALLLLHELRGEAVSGAGLPSVALDLATHEVGAALDIDTAAGALSSTELCETVDELAEAAYSGERVLRRLLDTFRDPDGPWAGEALTTAGEELLAAVLIEVHRAQPRTINPIGPAGLLLTTVMAAHLREQEQATIVFPSQATAQPCDLAAARWLAARGLPAVSSEAAVRGPEGRFDLLACQQPASNETFFDQVEQALLELGERDVLAVVGPARLMTDAPGEDRRRRLLTPSSGYFAPLRYVARLPKGMSRYGGRRRLALWVFAESASTWTVVGAHSDTSMDSATAGNIAADVVAALSDKTGLRHHAFTTSTVLNTAHLLRRPTLALPAATTPAVEGGDQLARIWELDTGELLRGISLAAATSEANRVTWPQAISKLAKDFPGVRLPPDQLGSPQTGWVVIVGPEELRDPPLVGMRGIDRLILEAVAPRARLTQPGDVIYVATGAPTAIVDQRGGQVVQAPARIFRCRDAESDDRQLTPAVVAADISSQRGSDRDAWMLRTVPTSQAGLLTDAIKRTEQRRQELLRDLQRIDALETELIDGLSAGSLTAELNTFTTQKEK